MEKKVGRPPKTVKDLPENWASIIISIMEEGGSAVEVCAELDICRNTFKKLVKQDQEFMNTVKRGLIKCQAWWEKSGRKGINQGKDFNATTWIFNMMNRFAKDWKNKKEVETKNTNTNLNSDIDYSKLSDEEFEILYKLIAKAGSSNQSREE